MDPALKAWSERLLGKQEQTKVYFGTDGQTLFAQFNALSDEGAGFERVDYVNQLADNVIVPVYFSSSQPQNLCVGGPPAPDGAPRWTTAPLCGPGPGFVPEWVPGLT